MGDKLTGLAHPLREQIEKRAQGIVIQLCRSLDDARGCATLGRLEHLRELLGEFGRQMLQQARVYGCDRQLESKGPAAGRDRGGDLETEPRRDQEEPAE